MLEDKKIDEILLKIGAKVVDELLLHEAPVEVRLKQDKFFDDVYEIYVDVHRISVFRESVKTQLRNRAFRATLPLEIQTEIDKIK